MGFEDRVKFVTPPLDGGFQKAFGLFVLGTIILPIDGFVQARKKLVHEKGHLYGLNHPMQLGLTTGNRVFTNPVGTLTFDEVSLIALGADSSLNLVDLAILAVMPETYTFKRLYIGDTISYF